MPLIEYINLGLNLMGIENLTFDCNVILPFTLIFSKVHR